MLKAFISILGTNDYLECRHKYPDGTISDTPVKYIQEDLIKYYCKDWNDECEIRIFFTEEARKKNWLNDGHYKDGKIIENKGLYQRIKELNLPVKVKGIDIPNGYNETEIWSIFELLFKSFRENEEVIIDITHAFRFMPLLLTILLNYSKLLKRINIVGIYYAAFESLGTIQEFRYKNPDEIVVPVIDLTSFKKLQDWTLATFDFIHHGDVKSLSDLIKSERDSYWKVSVDDWKLLRDSVKKLEDLSLSVAFCRGKLLQDTDWDELKSNILKPSQHEILIKPFIPLLEIIEKKIINFEKSDEKLLIASVEWCMAHNLYQQAITLLQEFSITMILHKENYEWSEKTNRDLTAKAFHIYSRNIPEEEWEGMVNEDKELVKKLLSSPYIKKLCSSYSKLAELRNDVNHAGFLNNSKSVCSIKSKLENIIDNYKNILLTTHAH